MIKLTQASLAKRLPKEGEREFIFVEFNAWLYQGYDDARAALMDVIATKLEAEAKARKKGLEKAQALLKRVNWLRAAKLGAGSALAMSFGSAANRTDRRNLWSRPPSTHWRRGREAS